MSDRRSVITVLVGLVVGVGVWYVMAAALRATFGPHCQVSEYVLRASGRPDVVLDHIGCPLSAWEIAVAWAVALAVGLASCRVAGWIRR